MDGTALQFVRPPIQPLMVLATVVGHLTATAPAETFRSAANPTLVLELAHLLDDDGRISSLLSRAALEIRWDAIFTTHHATNNHFCAAIICFCFFDGSLSFSTQKNLKIRG